ncbi:RNA dependent RNA polymerase-domain-containing protein [Flagelloscypha sp. PMI_526]|nr:RNA dependent RNA polymerase-domain-containing protein [Flagelloscypha sp. PMI_526]
MEVELWNIPWELDDIEVQVAVAARIHAIDPTVNLKLQCNRPPEHSGRSDGRGTLVLPSVKVGNGLLGALREDPLILTGNETGKKTLKCRRQKSISKDSDRLFKILQLTPYMDPLLPKQIEDIESKLRVESLNIDIISFGRYCSPQKGSKIREFSIEWGLNPCLGALKLSLVRSSVQITIKDSATASTIHRVVISFSSIERMAVGYDPNGYVSFDITQPAFLFKQHGVNPETGEARLMRVRQLREGHATCAPFCPQIRIQFDESASASRFFSLCKLAGLDRDRRMVNLLATGLNAQVNATSHFALYSFRKMRALENLLTKHWKHDWAMRFHLTAFLWNGLLDPDTLQELINAIIRDKQLVSPGSHSLLLELLRQLLNHLPYEYPRKSLTECFMELRRTVTIMDTPASLNSTAVRHVVITPTRKLLQGPFPCESNFVLQRYRARVDNFIRVDFKEEDQTPLRWRDGVSGPESVAVIIKDVLKHGLEVAGKHFSFLAYSGSSLDEGSFWFVTPFDGVTAESIRKDFGDFGRSLVKVKELGESRPVTHFPALYAARLSLKFTSTEGSVLLQPHEWNDTLPDLNGKQTYYAKIKKGSISSSPAKKVYESTFTDGIGTMSSTLADEIWKLHCSSQGIDITKTTRPDAVQLRVEGYKGVIAVDKRLDATGIKMRLRGSMKKFESLGFNQKQPIQLQIAEFFGRYKPVFGNRQLIMAMEGKLVSLDAVKKLQNDAIMATSKIRDTDEEFIPFLKKHSLGISYGLSRLIERLDKHFGLCDIGAGLQNDFFKRLREGSRQEGLREIMYDARFLFPESYKVVGLVDEGPAYIEEGKLKEDEIFCLKPNEIFLCLRERLEDGEIKETYIEGLVSISRSPITNLGDVQSVQAIGKPPSNLPNLFGHLRNGVVFSSKGDRSLQSCLSGGDNDGDEYDVIVSPELRLQLYNEPLKYPSISKRHLGRPCTMDDVVDFVGEYLVSNNIGLITNRLLTIAGLDGKRNKKIKRISKMCSQARSTSSAFIKYLKPDWQAPEPNADTLTDTSGRPQYYRSNKLLGILFRNEHFKHELKQLEDISTSSSTTSQSNSKLAGYSLPSDPISLAVYNMVQPLLNKERYCSFDCSQMRLYYNQELDYIRKVHALNPQMLLIEEELVLGAILSNQGDRAIRKSKKFKMRFHVGNLVTNIQRRLLRDAATALEDELIETLNNTWSLWVECQKRGVEFGARSLGLIALGVILECIERLDLKSSEE